MLAVKGILSDPPGQRTQMVEDIVAECKELEFNLDSVIKHEAHVAFHRKIWAASENTTLLPQWPVTEAHLTIVAAQDKATRDDPLRGHKFHKYLLDAREQATWQPFRQFSNSTSSPALLSS